MATGLAPHPIALAHTEYTYNIAPDYQGKIINIWHATNIISTSNTYPDFRKKLQRFEARLAKQNAEVEKLIQEGEDYLRNYPEQKEETPHPSPTVAIPMTPSAPNPGNSPYF